MLLGGNSRRAVVLTGAGATRGAYTGIGRAKIRPPLNADFFDVARRFVGTTAGGRFNEALRRLEGFIDNEMRIRPSESHTMEQIFNVLFLSKDMPRIFSKGGKPRIPGYRREISDFVKVVVGLLRYVQANPRHPKKIDHHARLVGALEPGDTIISLNYDTILDNALLAAGWDPRKGYGFSAGHKVRFDKNTGLLNNGSLREVLLLKPHGSLSWFARGSVEDYERALLRRPPSRIEMSAVPRANLRSDEVRFFIPPLYVKFFANKFWRLLWESAFRRLVKADILIIVGCSLVETDFHLRSIVGSAIARRAEKFHEIIIVEPSDSVAARLKSFLRGRSNHGFVPFRSFTEFVESM